MTLWTHQEEWWGRSATARLNGYKAEAQDCGHWRVKCDGEIVSAGQEGSLHDAMHVAQRELQFLASI